MTGAAVSPRIPGNLPQVLALACLLLIATVVLSIMGLLHPGSPPDHSVLAYSLLHGRVDVPASLYDHVPYRGLAYLPFGPLPAALMIPAVLAVGPLVPDILLGLILAFCTLPGLDALWKELGWSDSRERLWLTMLVTGGTVWLAALVVNSSYYVNHLLVFALLLWALVLALRGRAPTAAGLLVGLATLTRSSSVLALLPLAGVYMVRVDGRRDRLLALSLLVVGCLPGVLFTGVYNAARFGSPLESGYSLQQLAYPPLAAARAVGLFSLAHLPKNLYYLLIAGPLPLGGVGEGVLRFPWVVPSTWGMGVLWVSPWILAGMCTRGRLGLVLALGGLFMLIPDLFYYGVGWKQFGYRYALDALPFFAAWAALGLRKPRAARWVPLLAVYGVAVNIAGAAWLLQQT
jgi:hypothetical protein